MATNLPALQALVKLLADSATDAAQGNSLVQDANLIPDLMALVPQIGDIPAEVKDLKAEDYEALLAALTAELVLPAGKAENLVVAGLKIVNLLVPLVSAVEAFVAATKA